MYALWVQSTGEQQQFDPFALGITGSPREAPSEPASAHGSDPFWQSDGGQGQPGGADSKFDAFGMDDVDEDPSTPLAALGLPLGKVAPHRTMTVVPT